MSGDTDAGGSSRRRLLALLTAAVLALLGAGTGISDLLTGGDDGETGRIDLSLDYAVTPDEPNATPTPTPTPTPDGADAPGEKPDPTSTTGTERPERDPTPTATPRRHADDDSSRPRAAATTPSDEAVVTATPPVSVSDIEPGDGGTVDLSVTLSGESARLWLRADAMEVEENGLVEVERAAGDAGEPGELHHHVQVRLWYGADTVAYEGTLADLGERDDWIALTETCVAPGTGTAHLRWELPPDVPNVVQTDAVSFSLGVAADADECA